MTDLGREIAWVDTLDACHLKCPTCIRGVRGMQNSPRKMSLDTFAASSRSVEGTRFPQDSPFQLDRAFLEPKYRGLRRDREKVPVLGFIIIDPIDPAHRQPRRNTGCRP